MFTEEISVVEMLSKETQKQTKLCDWLSEEEKKDCKVKEVIKKGDFIEEILAEAKNSQADLLVINVSHRIFNDQTLGEKTSEIIRNAPCPVIAVSEQIETKTI